ncbi:MAG: bifunctional 4-hydroxy-2-oxoglutarate aldolase/2-dehydro-3-deoxy-phosphogluconate aldolase [Candidatus Coatesbacteria bacterium]|nr:bifunctional 4-hydroxy-2-oxoglutarate aldolase/2-dehydro-3-deoxy-phosphogluconate aldolase [Candidatus Coatesbacteria bacterium]
MIPERLREDGLELSRRLRRARLLPVLRTREPGRAEAVGRALIESGATVLEVALTSPDAFETIAALSASQCLIGAASVVDRAGLEAAVAARADFLVCPHLDPELVEASREAGRPLIPAAATPSEALLARRLGCELIKVFPARELGGPAFIKALLAPLPGLCLLPAGGIGLEDVAAYLEAGAWCAAVGGSLLRHELMDAEDWTGVGRLFAETQRRLCLERFSEKQPDPDTL